MSLRKADDPPLSLTDYLSSGYIRPALRYVVITLAAWAAFGRTLNLWFVGTDTIPLIWTSRIHTVGDVVRILSNPLLYGTNFTKAGLFYRPVVNLTFALDYAIWGLTPAGYHLTNVLLHTAAAVLTMALVRQITDSLEASTLAGILFAVHPIALDVVPAASRRQDILMTVFGLVAILSFLRWIRTSRKRYEFVAVSAYGLALLSKEVAVLIPVILAVYLTGTRESLYRVGAHLDTLRKVKGFVGLTVAYLLVRFAALGGLGGYDIVFYPLHKRVLLFPVEYVLALAYPANSVAILATEKPLVLYLLSIVVGGLMLAIVWRKRRTTDCGRQYWVLVAGFELGVVAIPVAATTPKLGAWVLPSFFPTPKWYFVGLLFVSTSVCGLVLLHSLAHSMSFDSQLELFFLAWLCLPVGLFVLGGRFNFRSAYFFVVPFVGLLSYYLVEAKEAIDGDFGNVVTTPHAGVVVVLLCLLGGSFAASPIVHDSETWESASLTSQRSLTGVTDSARSVESDRKIIVRGVASKLVYHPTNMGQAHDARTISPYSVKAWLRLHGVNNPVEVHNRWVLIGRPTDVYTTSKMVERELVIRVHYEF